MWRELCDGRSKGPRTRQIITNRGQLLISFKSMIHVVLTFESDDADLSSCDVDVSLLLVPLADLDLHSTLDLPAFNHHIPLEHDTG